MFSRSLKSIRLSPQVRALLDIDKAQATPAEVMTAILRARVDLLWFGGIGTYVKAASEGHVDVGDPANDRIRVNAEQLRAKAIGEGVAGDWNALLAEGVAYVEMALDPEVQRIVLLDGPAVLGDPSQWPSQSSCAWTRARPGPALWP